MIKCNVQMLHRKYYRLIIILYSSRKDAILVYHISQILQIKSLSKIIKKGLNHLYCMDNARLSKFKKMQLLIGVTILNPHIKINNMITYTIKHAYKMYNNLLIKIFYKVLINIVCFWIRLCFQNNCGMYLNFQCHQGTQSQLHCASSTVKTMIYNK